MVVVRTVRLQKCLSIPLHACKRIQVAEHLGARLPASPPPGTHVQLDGVRKMPHFCGESAPPQTLNILLMDCSEAPPTVLNARTAAPSVPVVAQPRCAGAHRHCNCGTSTVLCTV